jgi:putative glutamine amidotransferase
MTPRARRRRPKVLIPARFSASASALRAGAEVASTRLVGSVWAAGGEPLTVHPDAPTAVFDDALVDEVAERFDFVDAVLLPGGGDMAARWSGQAPHEALYDVDEEQDAFDLALARWALRDRIPLLAICRGNQVVNVARGGDLVQDMTEVIGRDHRHLVHDVHLDAESPLRKVVDGDRLTISCYHHQALNVLGEGLKPAAHASDGTIEAVTIDGHEGWYLGVQWHPEDSADEDPVQASIFRAFVDAAG